MTQPKSEPITFTTTYIPCPGCGGFSACCCPVPVSPLERRFREILLRLKSLRRAFETEEEVR